MRKLLKFSAIMRIITIIALAAVIGFSMIACPDDGDGTPPPPPEDPTPVSADYDISNLWQTVENSVEAVTINPKPGKSSGAITIYYEGAGDTIYAKSGTPPTKSSVISKYRITFDVAAATGWKAANGLSAGLLIVFPIITTEPGVVPPSNSLENPYTIKLNIKDYDFVDFLGTTLQSMEDIYIKLDFSDSTITTIPHSVFNSYDENSTEECKWTGNVNLIHVILPDTVTTIEGNAFSKCTNLTSIDMGGVKEIKPWAFEYSGLEIVNIPNSVTIIGEGAFFICESLTSVTIGNSVTSIGEYAFEKTKKLTSVIIPANVTSIGEGAFNFTDALTSVTFEGMIPSSGFSENWVFPGDLRSKYFEGGIGTYIRGDEFVPGWWNPDWGLYYEWEKQ